MIVSSIYTTKICYQHLIFLFHHCITFDKAEECYVPYQMLNEKWPDWREKFIYLFDVSFFAYDENRKTKVHWLEKIHFDDEREIFFYQFSKEVWNNIQNIYRKYPEEYHGIMEFERMYTFNIFTWMKRNFGDTYCEEVEVQTLKNICMLKEDEYSSNTEFKRTILSKVIAELNHLLGWRLSIRTSDGMYEFSRR